MTRSEAFAERFANGVHRFGGRTRPGPPAVSRPGSQQERGARDHERVQHDPSFGPLGGIQRLFWLIPAAFLLGVSDSDALTAACAAVLVGAAWQGVYRRPLARRLAALLTAAGAGALLTRLGPGHWPTEVGSLVAVAALAATLAVTERALGALDTLHAGRPGGTVPAGT